MKTLLSVTALVCMLTASYAQENVNYQKPPEEILSLVDVSPAPSVLIDDQKEYMVLLYRLPFQTIEALSQEELRLAGLRINPKTNINSRAFYYYDIKVKSIQDKSGTLRDVTGLPASAQLTSFLWSPDQRKLAMTHTTAEGVEVWVLDVAQATMHRLTEAHVNANLHDAINWFTDSESLLVKMISKDRQALIDTRNTIPTGPTVSANNGSKAQNRTYQDLLKNKSDEHNFEQLALSELYKVSLDGASTPWLGSAMYDDISFSPNGKYVMVQTLEKPFSYLVPYYRFPSKTNIYTSEGKPVETVAETPLLEDLPKGFMATQTGKRAFSWRADKPASLVYAEALDKGDPAVDVIYRDAIYQLDAPFNGKPRLLIKLHNRYNHILWGNGTTAMAFDRWWDTRNTKTYLFNPDAPATTPNVLYDRNYQDRYSDPGDFVTHRNALGKNVLYVAGNKAYLQGDGYTEQGQFPFIDKLDIKTHKTSRLYQSKYTDKLETLYDFDPATQTVLVRIESQNEYPNYYFRQLKRNKLTQLTAFENPFKSLEGVHKEVLTYTREDGLPLTATLYLPAGYDRNKKEKLPMFMWAYPREYKDKSSAGQNTQNPNEFISPYWGSPVLWVARGFAVLDDTAFPIVGEGDTEPNDSFRQQLVANAKAAIDAVDALGYIDRNRVAVGGHSYGAFMVANLLSHADLFAAGIARSGAYNRTLTPFGFQSEQRSYWEAPEVYYTMSPFMHADKMHTPLLLVHGEADNNSGTYPMQSERYFNALKGLGATVRLVMLPKESHGYRARENILHLLWEQDQWLDQYVKHKDESSSKKP